MTNLAITHETAIEGDVELSNAQHVTAGNDLDYVLNLLVAVDPIDVESEDPSDADWAVHNALSYVRDEIAKRRAVQAGPDAVGDYCGVSRDHGRACGADLGLPDCRYHSTCGVCGLAEATGGQWWFRDHANGCPLAAKALDRRETSEG